MDYALSQLIGWARRAGGDRVTPQRDELVTDGTNQLVLNNDGSITIATVQVAGNTIDPANYSTDGSTITLATTPATDTSAVVIYSQSTYSDQEISEFILDAAKTIQSELVADYTVDSNTLVVSDPKNIIIKVANQMDPTIEKLIAVKSGILIREDIANSAAGDAILVKDGDTTIDTGKTAAGNEAALKRMVATYERQLKWAVANRPKGSGITPYGEVITGNGWFFGGGF